MQRGGYDRLRPAFAQTVQMPFGGGKLGIAQQRLLREKLARFIDVARHEDAESDPQRVHGSLVECRQFFRAPGRKLEPALDLLGRELAQILVDDVAHMLEIDGKGDDLHRPLSLALVEAAARQFGHIKLDRLVETVHGIVHPHTWSTRARSLVIIAAITLRSMTS